MLRESGAAEVHVRISSPPVSWPCFYGIDFASRAELVATSMSPDQICALLGADSLAYVSLDALVEATHQPKESLCRACFDGVYPIDLPEAGLDKFLLEGPAMLPGTGGPIRVPDLDQDGLVQLVAGTGGGDALRRL
jgi:amidophosphoribosyltransferase